MSNRDKCIAVINSMADWQLQSVFEMLQAVKNTIDSLESGAAETREILSNPDFANKLIDGKNTPLSECLPESEAGW